MSFCISEMVFISSMIISSACFVGLNFSFPKGLVIKNILSQSFSVMTLATWAQVPFPVEIFATSTVIAEKKKPNILKTEPFYWKI